jgi:hypothetical protein
LRIPFEPQISLQCAAAVLSRGAKPPAANTVLSFVDGKLPSIGEDKGFTGFG